MPSVNQRASNSLCAASNTVSASAKFAPALTTGPSGWLTWQILPVHLQLILVIIHPRQRIPDSKPADRQPDARLSDAGAPATDGEVHRGHRAHFIALGFGLGLSPVAPGTAGTLWAWLSFLLLQRWLSPAEIGWLIAASLPVGWADRLSHGVDPAADRHAWTWAGLASWPKRLLG